MDLSKLPKLSESPAPPPVASPDDKPTSPVAGNEPRADRIPFSEAGVDALISVVVGGIFLMLGASYGGWLIAKMNGQTYDTLVTWQSGPMAGQTVDLFELTGGTGWLLMGQWVLGACLIFEAIAVLGAAMIPRLKTSLIILAILLCVGGAVANVIAVVMQIKMGFTQPIFSMLGILIGGVIAFFHGRHLTARR